ncbi:protein-tyrosine-phosphatase [Frankia sp. AiPa1]|nr:protein-tyrosine-phosphatase [Frankia sp. AiPa1]
MVCTGNLCRSPMAQHLAASYFSAPAGFSTRTGSLARTGPVGRAGAEGIVIASAGLHARTGEAMEHNAAELLRARGVDPAGFQSRHLTVDLVESSDLVLCATREHRSAVVTLSPRALRRSFTLREFARLTSAVRLADLPVGSVRPAGELLVAAALRARAAGRVVPAEIDDLTDPLGENRHRFEACAAMIDEALCGPMSLLSQASQTRRDGPSLGAIVPAPRRSRNGERTSDPAGHGPDRG